MRGVNASLIGKLVRVKVRQLPRLGRAQGVWVSVCRVFSYWTLISSSTRASTAAAQGIVTHVTDVKPLASVITYTDELSGSELYQEVLGRWGRGVRGGGGGCRLGSRDCGGGWEAW